MHEGTESSRVSHWHKEIRNHACGNTFFRRFSRRYRHLHLKCFEMWHPKSFLRYLTFLIKNKFRTGKKWFWPNISRGLFRLRSEIYAIEFTWSISHDLIYLVFNWHRCFKLQKRLRQARSHLCPGYKFRYHSLGESRQHQRLSDKNNCNAVLGRARRGQWPAWHSEGRYVKWHKGRRQIVVVCRLERKVRLVFNTLHSTAWAGQRHVNHS